MSARSDEISAKRRKVRKGTHSCWNCRRRKVRCIFALPDDTTCIMCRRRSTTCVSQGVLEDAGITDNDTTTVEVSSCPDDQLAWKNGADYGVDAQNTDSSCAPPTFFSTTATPEINLQSGSLVGSEAPFYVDVLIRRLAGKFCNL